VTSAGWCVKDFRQSSLVPQALMRIAFWCSRCSKVSGKEASMKKHISEYSATSSSQWSQGSNYSMMEHEIIRE
jgi:hypothetical protein